jgi:hypothetical protein
MKGGGEDPRKKQMQIKRFDPSNPESYALVVSSHTVVIFIVDLKVE